MPVLLLCGTGLFFLSAQSNAPLLGDAELESGYLPDGTAYFIRPTEWPDDRYTFRLLVAVGSGMERPDQRGNAHFVEHMAFNGLRSWPGRGLDMMLSTLNPGMDLESNAFTGSDSTIYLFELPLEPVDTLETGVRVLHEMAYWQQFDPIEVELERGVILGELREYDTPGDRLIILEDRALFADSRYREADPLGTSESVRATTPEGLRDFYETWYRPELMAVIVSGPVNPRKALDRLRYYFTPERQSARRAAPYPVGPDSEAAALSASRRGAGSQPVTGSQPAAYAERFLSEDRLPTAMRGLLVPRGLAGRSRLRLFFSAGREPLVDSQAYEQRIRQYAAAYAFSLRLRGLSGNGSVPWIYHDCGAYDDYGNNGTVLIEVSCPAGDERATLESLATELAAFRQFGASPLETGYAVDLALSDMPYYEPDAYDLTDEIEAAFLWAGLVPNRQQIEKLEKNAASRLEDSPGTPMALGMQAGDLPDASKGLLSVQTRAPVDAEALAGHWRVAWDQAVSSVRSGESGSQAGQTALRNEQPRDLFPAVTARNGAKNRGGQARPRLLDGLVDDSSRLELANGLTLHLQPDEEADDELVLAAWSAGGLRALADPALLPAAAVLGTVMTEALYSALGSKQMEYLTSYNSISIDVEIREWDESIILRGPAGSLQELFGLMQALLSRLPDGPGLLERVLLKTAELASDQEPDATAAVDRAMASLLRPVPLLLPNAQTIADLDSESLQAAWRDRFGNPADFQFVLTGEFETADAGEAAGQWLGGLGTSERLEALQASPTPTRLTEGELSAGVAAGRQASLRHEADYAMLELRWPVRLDSPEDAYELEVIASVLYEAAFIRIREELSATYGVDVFVDRPHPDLEYAELVVAYRAPAGRPELLPETLKLVQRAASEFFYEEFGWAWLELDAYLEEREPHEQLLLRLRGQDPWQARECSVDDLVEHAREWLAPQQAYAVFVNF